MKTTSTLAVVKHIFIFCFSLLTYPALSQIELVKDINKFADQGSNPNGFNEAAGSLYFLANDGEHGQELWRTNGTSDGTLLIQDINPGLPTGVTSGTKMVVFSSKLYFLADDGEHGKELWSTENESVSMVEDLRTGDNSNHIFHLTVVNNLLLFQASPVIGDEEWWKVTHNNSLEIVKDIYKGSGGAQLGAPKVGTDWMFFEADSGGVVGEQLWITDGTETGTKTIDNRRVGIGPGIEYNGKVYFMAEEVTDGFELFKVNQSGASLVRDINPEEGGSSQPKAVDFHGMVYKGELYFNAYEPTHRDALWKTDGTEEGTILVKDIYSGASSGKGYIGAMQVFNDHLYFTAEDATPGLDLWRTDGTEEGTVKVKDFEGGIANNFYELDSQLYFIANDVAHGNELWITDGTEEGTRMVQDFNPGADHGIWAITVFEDKIFLSGNGPSGNELYAYTPIDCEIPQITTQPAGDTIDVGGSITLSVAATGNDLTYQWQKDSVIIPGATETTFTIEDAVLGDSGQYTCVVANPCTTVTFQVAKVVVKEIISGVGDEFVIKDGITLFPNPANGRVQISMNSQRGHPKVSLSVYNMQGRLVMEKLYNMNEDVLDVSKLTPGLYQIKVTDNRHRVAWSKLAIDR